MSLDPSTCYRALCARDRRFDGVFFVGVSTTGIYCRPVCPARTPGRDRCRFFHTRAEAERDGFRACFRCRPELAPGQGPIDALPRLVAEAVARIEAGALDAQPVGALAGALGVSERHLRRALTGALGVGPADLAGSRRLALAKQLLQDSALPVAEVAFAAGFASVRRFNAAFLERFGRPPTALRRERGTGAPGALELRLDFRPPHDAAALLAFLAARAVPGVEEVADGRYRRTVRLGDRAGWVAVRLDPERPAFRAEVALPPGGSLTPLVARLRVLLDLDAHPAAIAAHLGQDPRLGPLLRRRPGLRVPGAFDGFETAVRAILGQQVSVRAATTIAGRLVERFGEPVETPFPGLRRLFPRAEVLADAGESAVARLGMPGARARTVIGLARAVAREGLSLEPGGDVEARLARLRELPGVGAWTAQVLALRALRWPDAFPAGDLGVRLALGGAGRAEAERLAERWRPWRAYAVMHLWSDLAARGASRTEPSRGGCDRRSSKEAAHDGDVRGAAVRGDDGEPGRAAAPVGA